jgi:hypothetical protein
MSMSPEEYLAIPYVLVMESVEKEEKRVRFIMERLERGEPIPVPRAPLRAGVEGPDPDKLGFAKWLVDQDRISDKR